ASRLAVAIENARLFQQVRAQADTLLLLNEVSRETSSILDLEELLRRAAEQIKRVIDYQILSLMLYDEEQKVFRHRIDVKHGQRVQGKLRSAATEGIVGAAATLRDGESGDAQRTRNSDDSQGEGHRCAGSRELAGELLHARSRSNAFHPGRQSRGFA